MKKYLLEIFFAVLAVLVFCPEPAAGQDSVRKPPYYEGLGVRHDTVYTIRTPAAIVTGTRRPKISGNDARLGLAVYVTYGIAKQARVEIEAMNAQLEALGDDRQARRRYVQSVENKLVEQYTPVLKEMSMYQGKVLLKLIDRETGNSSYQWVREMKGGFSAFFWQGIARIFGANLKSTMDDSREDRLIAFYADLYDEGLLRNYLVNRTTVFDKAPKTKKKRK